jgi:acyl dehydratase
MYLPGTLYEASMNLSKVMSLQFAPVKQTLTASECILYALGIGIGERVTDPDDLRYVYEQGLRVFPSMVNVICHPGAWIQAAELDIDWIRAVHGEQSFVLYEDPAVGHSYVASHRVAEVIDKGVGKGAILIFEKTINEQATGSLVSTVTSTYFLRGDGGGGGTTERSASPGLGPMRQKPQRIDLATLRQAGLLYRLSGDYNPIHASPDTARKAGFDRPILHGLCTLGVATRAIMQSCLKSPGEKLKRLRTRFTAPFYPGETLGIEYAEDDEGVQFRGVAVERNVIVLNGGFATIAAE